MPPSARSRLSQFAAIAVVALAFAIPAAAVIVAGVERTAAFADQRDYHLPTIAQFLRQWPTPDLSSYPAAMTPGYHLLMTAVVRVGGGVAAMQWATLAITTGLLATLAAALARRLRPIDVIFLGLPMAWSQYVMTAGVYVVPHNLAWWLVLAVLLIAVDGEWSGRSAGLSAFRLAATVFVRQIHLWLAAPLVVRAWQSGAGRTRWVRAAIAIACAAPSVLVLAYFFRLWGGLAPAAQPWAKPADGVNVAAIVIILATFGLLTPLMIARLPKGQAEWSATIAGLIAGLALSLAIATTFDRAGGRWSALWNHAALLGFVGDRSVLITLLATIGGGCVGLLLTICRDRRCVWLAALVGFVAANAAVNLAWQRYYEPMALMMTALILREDRGPVEARGLAVQWGSRLALALLQAALTIAAFR